MSSRLSWRSVDPGRVPKRSQAIQDEQSYAFRFESVRVASRLPLHIFENIGLGLILHSFWCIRSTQLLSSQFKHYPRTTNSGIFNL